MGRIGIFEVLVKIMDGYLIVRKYTYAAAAGMKYGRPFEGLDPCDPFLRLQI